MREETIKQGKLHAQSVGGVVFIPREEIDLMRTMRTKRDAD